MRYFSFKERLINFSYTTFTVRISRTGISKGALVKAALDNDSAAEHNVQINAYNATILGIIQENYEMDKVRKSLTHLLQLPI